MITPPVLSLSLCFLDRSSSSVYAWQDRGKRKREGRCARRRSILVESIPFRWKEGGGPRFREFYWAGKVVPVKVLSFRERGLSSSRFHCDSTLLVARWPRGEVRKERKEDASNRWKKYFYIRFLFPRKERKKEKSRISLFLPYSIPLIDQRSARPIIIKTAPLLPSLRDARAAKRRHAAKGKLFSSGKLQTGGRGVNCVHANPAG